MARPRRIADTSIFALIRTLLAEQGPRGVSFAAVALRCGLAAPSLVERYGSRDQMVRAALTDGWDRLDQTTTLAIAATGNGSKGAAALLKSLAPSDPALPPPDLPVLLGQMPDPALRQRAALWRQRVIEVLAEKLNYPGQDRAEMLFAAWQGRLFWEPVTAGSFRLRDAARLISAPLNPTR